MPETSRRATTGIGDLHLLILHATAVAQCLVCPTLFGCKNVPTFASVCSFDCFSAIHMTVFDAETSQHCLVPSYMQPICCSYPVIAKSDNDCIKGIRSTDRLLVKQLPICRVRHNACDVLPTCCCSVMSLYIAPLACDINMLFNL